MAERAIRSPFWRVGVELSLFVLVLLLVALLMLAIAAVVRTLVPELR